MREEIIAVIAVNFNSYFNQTALEVRNYQDKSIIDEKVRYIQISRI